MTPRRNHEFICLLRLMLGKSVFYSQSALRRAIRSALPGCGRALASEPKMHSRVEVVPDHLSIEQGAAEKPQ
jgi:hypothetical protein